MTKEKKITIIHSPLSDPHGEGVDVLVELVEQSDALNDHVVGLVDVELNLGPAVAVGEAELGLVGGAGCEPLHQLGEMHANAAQDLSKYTIKS